MTPGLAATCDLGLADAMHSGSTWIATGPCYPLLVADLVAHVLRHCSTTCMPCMPGILCMVSPHAKQVALAAQKSLTSRLPRRWQNRTQLKHCLLACRSTPRSPRSAMSSGCSWTSTTSECKCPLHYTTHIATSLLLSTSGRIAACPGLCCKIPGQESF